MEYFDITPTISEKIVVFPGDVPFTREIAMDFAKGDGMKLSSTRATLHLGAHADAPNHYMPGGEDIASRSLDYYLGPCQVIHVAVAQGARIYPKDLTVPIEAARVLFATGSFSNYDQWTATFNSLAPELIEQLADQGVKLLGIDTPSIDPASSIELESHQAVARGDLAILEGLALSHVPDGLYYLLALPLKIEGADASPVRAVLLKDHPAG